MGRGPTKAIVNRKGLYATVSLRCFIRLSRLKVWSCVGSVASKDSCSKTAFITTRGGDIWGEDSPFTVQFHSSLCYQWFVSYHSLLRR